MEKLEIAGKQFLFILACSDNWAGYVLWQSLCVFLFVYLASYENNKKCSSINDEKR